MKKLIISQLLNLYVTALHITKKVGRLRKQSSALILPPSSPGNLGDEALITSAFNYLKNKGIKYIGIISYKKGSQWRSIDKEQISEIIEMENYFAYGGSRRWLNLFRIIPQFSKYEKFYCLGADMMDGHYSDIATFSRIQLVSVAVKMGIESAILGFSFNDKPTPQSIKSFRELPTNVRICTRDPISQQRLESRINRPVQLVADLAFLLSPTPTTKIASEVLDWIDKQKINNRLVIGLTPYTQLDKKLQIDTVEKLVQIYVDSLVELYARNESLSFVLLAHDFRNISSKPSDIVISEAILKLLPEPIKPYTLKVPTPCTAADVKAIVGNLDFVLSGKFHLTIACLGQGTPVAGITYQDKFEGLFQLFELEGLTITPTEFFQKRKLINFLIPLIEKRQEIKEKIELKLPHIKDLAEKNFEL